MNQIEDLLRTSLRERARTTEPARRVPEVDIRRRARRNQRRQRLVPAVGATAVLLGTVGVVAVRQRDDRTSIAAEVPAALPESSLGGEVPRLSMAGWATVRYQELAYGQEQSPARLIIERDGTTILVTVFVPPMSYSLGDGARPVDIDGNDAGIVRRNDETVVAWQVGDVSVAVIGRNATDDEVVEVARGLRFEGPDLRITSVDHVPEGATVTELEEVLDQHHNVEYEFARDDASIQLHLYAGGRATYEMRVNGDGRSAVEVLGHPASLLDYGNGRYRVDVLIGDRTWEFDGAPFASAEEFLAAVDATREVGRAEWQRSLTDAEITRSSLDGLPEPPTPAPGVK